MMDEKLEALLWQEIEGGLSAEDRDALDDRLSADADARAARERLSTLSEGLSSLQPVDPPAELRPRIRQAIAGRARRPREPFIGRVRATLQSLAVGRVRFAYLVAGILVGVVVSLLLSGGFDPTTPVDRGTLYGAANLGADRWLEIELPEGAGVLRLSREGSKLTTALTSSEPLELEVKRSEDGSVAVEVSTEGSPILERKLDWSEIPGS